VCAIAADRCGHTISQVQSSIDLKESKMISPTVYNQTHPEDPLLAEILSLDEFEGLGPCQQSVFEALVRTGLGPTKRRLPTISRLRFDETDYLEAMNRFHGMIEDTLLEQIVTSLARGALVLASSLPMCDDCGAQPARFDVSSAVAIIAVFLCIECVGSLNDYTLGMSTATYMILADEVPVDVRLTCEGAIAELGGPAPA